MKKGLSSAITIVITIVVLLIIALAIIGITTGTIGKLGETSNKAPGGDALIKGVCSSQVTKDMCDLYPDSCVWQGDKCVAIESATNP